MLNAIMLSVAVYFHEMLTVTTLYVIMLSVVMGASYIYFNAECRYAGCRYPDCRYSECRGAMALMTSSLERLVWS